MLASRIGAEAWFEELTNSTSLVVSVVYLGPDQVASMEEDIAQQQ
jgi:hypothetical protein